MGTNFSGFRVDLAGINFSVLVLNFSVLIFALEPVNGKFDDVCRDVTASDQN